MGINNTDVDSLSLMVLSDFAAFIDDAETSDVRFIIGKDSSRFNAHRLILWARSPAFRKYRHQFWNNGISQRPLTFVYAHYEINAFRKVMEFLYTGQISLQLGVVFGVMLIGAEFELTTLVTSCQKFIIGVLNVENACHIWRQLHTMQENNPDIAGWSVEGLLQTCQDYVFEQMTECAFTDAWLQLPRQLLMTIVNSDEYACKADQMWPSMLSWAKYQTGIPLDKMAAELHKYEKELIITALSGLIAPMNEELLDGCICAEHRKFNESLASCESISSIEKSSEYQFEFFAGSSLLCGDYSRYQEILNFWYGVADQKWRRLYRACKDGFSAQDFHKRCDGIATTYVIVQSSTGSLFGGFSDVQWSSDASVTGQYVTSNRVFLFDLLRGNLEPCKYDIHKTYFAILQHADFGPIFGAGADLCIASNGDKNEDSYRSAHSYYGNGDEGCHYFYIQDYEVYTPITDDL